MQFNLIYWLMSIKKINVLYIGTVEALRNAVDFLTKNKKNQVSSYIWLIIRFCSIKDSWKHLRILGYSCKNSSAPHETFEAALTIQLLAIRCSLLYSISSLILLDPGHKCLTAGQAHVACGHFEIRSVEENQDRCTLTLPTSNRACICMQTAENGTDFMLTLVWCFL